MSELPKELAITLNNDKPQLTLQPSFQNLLTSIHTVVAHTTNLVSLQNINLDKEDDIVEAIAASNEAQRSDREVQEIRRNLKKYLTGKYVDDVMDQFDAYVDKSGASQLASLNAQAKQLKKDLSALRITKNWEVVKEAFDANIANYPLIKQLAPNLMDFNLFKLRHPKLVTGAKTWRFGDKQRQEVNQDLFEINECLQDLADNTMKLPEAYRIGLLNQFISQPTKISYLDNKNRMINQVQLDIQRQQMIASQSQSQALQASQSQSSQAVAPSSSASASAATVQPKTPDQKATEWLYNYTLQNRLLYPNLANNDAQKAKLVYDLIHQLDNPQSAFSQFINGDNQLEMAVLKQIVLV